MGMIANFTNGIVRELTYWVDPKRPVRGIAYVVVSADGRLIRSRAIAQAPSAGIDLSEEVADGCLQIQV